MSLDRTNFWLTFQTLLDCTCETGHFFPGGQRHFWLTRMEADDDGGCPVSETSWIADPVAHAGN